MCSEMLIGIRDILATRYRPGPTRAGRTALRIAQAALAAALLAAGAGACGADSPADQRAKERREAALAADRALTLRLIELRGIVIACGEKQAVVAGHDWGAVVAWTAAGLHPDRVRGVVGMSVPATPRPPAPPAGLFREHMGEDFYFLWMARPETPALLGKDVRRTLATTKVWNAEWAAQEGDDPPTPPFMTDADLQVYVDAFERTGFENPLRWYRNLDRTWERTADAPPTIDVPAAFIAGERDPVGAWMPAQVMDGLVTDLRLSVTVPGAGHWVQQERPAEVNAALIEFLAGLDA